MRVDIAFRSTKSIFYSWSECGSISGAGRFRVLVLVVNFLFLVSVRVDFACISVSRGGQFRVRVDFACGSISRAVNLWAGNEYKGLGASEYLFLKNNKIKSRVAWSFLRRLEDQKQKINFVWPK